MRQAGRARLKTAAVSAEIARPITFWLGLTAVAVLSGLSFRGATLSDLAGFMAIVATALSPGALWCWRRVHGLPLFPLFALGTIGTFALPLIAHHPLVMDYSENKRFFAAIAVAGTNLIGTLPWYFLSRAAPHPPSSRCLILRSWANSLVFSTILAGTIVFNLAQMPLTEHLGASVYPIARAGVIALSNLAIFIVAYRWSGRGRSATDRTLDAALVVGVMISTLPSALMVGALSYGLLALIGYALGRGRVPWISLAALGAVALFLQGGKEDLRNKYWYSTDAAPITLADFPSMVTDWIRFSCAHLGEFRDDSPAPTTGDSQSLVERASLLQLFLRIQQMSPAEVPYLDGQTYRIIPGLLVPRALNENKHRTHLGTYMLAMHYDLQTSDDTLTTTIGFGLVNEAMANFGYVGCLALGLMLGTFYGAVARWSAGYPLLSLRSLLAILVLSVAFQNEFCAGVYITTLFQGLCVVLALVPFFMRRGSGRTTQFHPALAGAPA